MDILPKFSEVNSPDHHIQLQNYSRRSQGYKRLIQLDNGLDILICNYYLEDDLLENLDKNYHSPEVEFGFNLLEQSQDYRHSPQSTFFQFDTGEEQVSIREWQGKQRVIKVDLHIDYSFKQDSVQQSSLLSPTILSLLQTVQDFIHLELGGINPNIKMILLQMLDCPYQGHLETLYLQSKALELLAIQSHKIDLQSKHPQTSFFQDDHYYLKTTEIERLQLAKEILLKQIQQPPSLLQLARQVGLNDCTLKRGFRHYFGTTVFGYLRQQRLLQAQELLRHSEMNIAQVALTVGYSHSGYFAAAFKREFGMTPQLFRQQ